MSENRWEYENSSIIMGWFTLHSADYSECDKERAMAQSAKGLVQDLSLSETTAKKRVGSNAKSQRSLAEEHLLNRLEELLQS